MTTPARTARAAAVAAAIALLLAAQAALQLDFEQRSPQRRIENLPVPARGPPPALHVAGVPHPPRGPALDARHRLLRHARPHGPQLPLVFHILDQLTTLDPPFRYPYYFGGITLAVSAEHADESIRLLVFI